MIDYMRPDVFAPLIIHDRNVPRIVAEILQLLRDSSFSMKIEFWDDDEVKVRTHVRLYSQEWDDVDFTFGEDRSDNMDTASTILVMALNGYPDVLFELRDDVAIEWYSDDCFSLTNTREPTTEEGFPVKRVTFSVTGDLND